MCGMELNQGPSTPRYEFLSFTANAVFRDA